MKFIPALVILLFTACQTSTSTTTTSSAAPATVPAPSVSTAAPAADVRMEADARALLTAINAGNFAEATRNFDTQMMSALGPDKLSAFAQQLSAQAGAFKSVGKAQLSTVQGHRIVVLPAQYERANINVQVAFGADGKIAGLYFVPAQ